MKQEESKSSLGQFYTTNYGYILQNFEVPDTIEKIIEPFAGNCDLLKFLKNEERVECYDIQPKNARTIQRDTLMFPPDFSGSFVLTNPPFLARNKCKDKQVFDKYGENDLYKCFVKILIESECIGGILILPLNFFCSIRLSDKQLRRKFLEKYSITKLNIFEEKVFDDTSYTVCSFQFCSKIHYSTSICANIFPKNEEIFFILNESVDWSIGGEIYNLPQTYEYSVSRTVGGDVLNTNILLKCIDNNAGDTINLKIVSDKEAVKFVDTTPNGSCRTYAVISITPCISLEDQRVLVEKFNSFLVERREKYRSLFLCNYRESVKGFARKRISFGLAYAIINHLLIDLKTKRVN